jgi:hypothetical protein
MLFEEFVDILNRAWIRNISISKDLSRQPRRHQFSVRLKVLKKKVMREPWPHREISGQRSYGSDFNAIQ